jgi:penicillin-binding protein 1B
MIPNRNKKVPYRPRQLRNGSNSPTPRRQPRGFAFKWRWIALVIILVPSAVYVGQLDITVRNQFEGKRWTLPARVYARPLEIYTGMRLMPTVLVEELNALSYQATTNIPQAGQYQHDNNEFLVATRAFKFWDDDEPSQLVRIRFVEEQVADISRIDITQGNKVNESPLPLLRLEPKLVGKIYPTHREDRIVLDYKEVPKPLINALIAVEDRQFFEHSGLSFRGLLRAAIANLKAGEWIQGGSTLTQQLIKNFYLTHERTFKRKLNEAVMAFLLEFHYTKQQILEAYLNEVFLGQDGNYAIHGMGIAAQFYFDRPLKELKLPELALLVSLIRGASLYNPRKHPDKVLERRNLVLDKMLELGKITEGERIIKFEDEEIKEIQQAKEAPLGITENPSVSTFPYPAFIDLVRQQLHQDYKEADLHDEGLQIFTTLDPYIQMLGEKAMINGLKKLEKANSKARHLEGAMVVTGSENGEVIALVNGKTPHYAGFNRPLKAERPIGSLVKAAVYLAALEKSRTYNLLTVLDDSPYQWVDPASGKVWKPQNYDYRSHGQIALYRALAYSYNLATVRLGMELGMKKIAETLERLGVERKFQPYPSILLGSLSLTPLEVTQMYQTIASGGFRVPLRAIREVLDREGKPLQRYSLSIDQRFHEAPIFLLNQALQQVLRIGTGRQVAQTLPESMVLAGKTGTSNDLRDSWFAGFSSELLAVTWVGRDDNLPMGLTGGSGAMVIWGDFIRAVRPQATAPITPNAVQWRSINGNGERLPFIVNHQINSSSLSIGSSNISIR